MEKQSLQAWQRPTLLLCYLPTEIEIVSTLKVSIRNFKTKSQIWFSFTSVVKIMIIWHWSLSLLFWYIFNAHFPHIMVKNCIQFWSKFSMLLMFWSINLNAFLVRRMQHLIDTILVLHLCQILQIDKIKGKILRKKIVKNNMAETYA